MSMVYPWRGWLLALGCFWGLLASGQEDRLLPASVTSLQKGKQGIPRVYKARVEPHWFANDSKFWYRNDLPQGKREYWLVDAQRGEKQPAFDHGRLAAALSRAARQTVTADRLPIDTLEFSEDLGTLRFTALGRRWSCDLKDYRCQDLGPARRSPAPESPTPASPLPESPIILQQPASDDPLLDPADPDNPFFDPLAVSVRSVPEVLSSLQQPPRLDERPVRSPNGQWTAAIRNANIILRDAQGKEIVLTRDGKEGNSYGLLQWSPDSRRLVAFRIEPGDRKEVYLIESSPPGGGRARLHTRPYMLPGDKYPRYELHLFDVDQLREIPVRADPIDFGFPRLRWGRDGQRFTYQQVDRGHQRFRLVEVDVRQGAVRHLIDERSQTFLWTAHTESMGVPLITWLNKTNELIYASEKSGWRHLYLIDADTGQEKNAITHGEYVVRGIDFIDEERREIYFRASGRRQDQDPYFIHYYRVKFDGSALTPLTDGNGTHTVQFSPSRRYLIDTYSRVDHPPITELRRGSDGTLVCRLEEADISELQANGWQPLEPFAAKGRDGRTDIWGVIARPRNFDPRKKYPVIESIYAGPQGAFVPKAFSPVSRYRFLTELGYVVVQIDGMGTAFRSKAFHDVCWKNLKDAGFPDRILWHKAVAARYPWYDISRGVGIYGTSAGGQNALAALLFHGDFYTAAVAACGCHDNRLDKASWNEQWMGYPVGPHYAACSNVDNAHRLQGKLLLIVGEMDTNVPPENTYRVVDALIKANKDFELLVIPGMGHSDGGPYGRRRLQQFFLRHLPPPP
ncbi:MAG: DPP IV N-terminal domain-containing protein [Thermogemmata sp.]